MASPHVVANPALLNNVGGATTTLVVLHRKLSMIVTISLAVFLLLTYMYS